MTLSELFVGGKALWVLPVSLIVFGAAFGLLPGLLLRMIVLLYPRDDPRRQELFGELYAPEMGRFQRYVWVFQQLETALRDGLGARRDARRARKEQQELRQHCEIADASPAPNSLTRPNICDAHVHFEARLERHPQLNSHGLDVPITSPYFSYVIELGSQPPSLGDPAQREEQARKALVDWLLNRPHEKDDV